VEEKGRNVDCSVDRDVEAIGEAYAGIEAVGRIAKRLKLDVRAINDRVEDMLGGVYQAMIPIASR
jgi:hypothetical protein